MMNPEEPTTKAPQNEPAGAPTPSSNEPNFNTNASQPGGNFKKYGKWISVAVILLILIIAAVLLIGGDKKSKDNSNASNNSNSSDQKGVIDAATLNNAKMDIPANVVTGLKANADGSLKLYTTQDDKCAIEFGTAEEKNLGGKTPEEVVDTFISFTKEGLGDSTANFTKQKIDDTVLKDATNADKSYRLPTYKVSFDGKRSGLLFYGVAIMKNNMRLTALYGCNDDQATQPQVDELAKKASQITITPQ